MTFTLAIRRRPPSASKGLNRKFQAALRQAVQTRFGKQDLMTGDLYCRIVWFHNEDVTQDVDNIAKQIVDPLKGVVFADDLTIAQCLISRIDARRDHDFDKDPAYTEVVTQLKQLLNQAPKHLLYIEVGVIPSQQIIFGTIDKGV
jgi:hypothetical protein